LRFQQIQEKCTKHTILGVGAKHDSWYDPGSSGIYIKEFVSFGYCWLWFAGIKKGLPSHWSNGK
jgi:hypothetical protein